MLASLAGFTGFATPLELSRIGDASSSHDLISVRVRNPSSAAGARAQHPELPGDPHYGDPAEGCRFDEADTAVDNIPGDLCAPSCTLFNPCPTDKPPGVAAHPECVLQDPTSQHEYCALVCSVTAPIVDQKAADEQCGTNASCKTVQTGIGICTYDD